MADLKIVPIGKAQVPMKGSGVHKIVTLMAVDERTKEETIIGDFVRTDLLQAIETLDGLPRKVEEAHFIGPLTR